MNELSYEKLNMTLISLMMTAFNTQRIVRDTIFNQTQTQEVRFIKLKNSYISTILST